MERMKIKIFKELYEMVSDEKSSILIDTSAQLCEYMDSNIPESEKDSFMETLLAITNRRQEYFLEKDLNLRLN